MSRRGIDLSPWENLSRRAPLLELALYHHLSDRGGPIRFGRMPYLVELYDVGYRTGLDVQACTQAGKTEWLLQLMFRQAGWDGRTVGYVLPSSQARDGFVQRRVNDRIAKIPAYRERLAMTRSRTQTSSGAPENLRIKAFGEGLMLFLSSKTSTDFVEFSADTMIVDELDLCDDSNLAKAYNRLREAPDPILTRVGNPTFPSVGIGRVYQLGDRRRYHWRCEACGHWQPIDWFRNVIRRTEAQLWELRHEEGLPMCRRCERPIRREASQSQWVAEETENDRRSYWISRLDIVGEDYRKLYREWIEAQSDLEALQTFFNDVLGQPYEASGARLSEELLRMAAVSIPMDMAPGKLYGREVIVAGVDVGKVLNVDVAMLERLDDATIRRSCFVGACTSFEEVEALLKRYRSDMVVVDERPEIHEANKLRAKLRRAEIGCYLCRFQRIDRVHDEPFGMRIRPESGIVEVDRTGVLDATLEDVAAGRRAWPSDIWTRLPDWCDQMGAPIRVLDAKRGVYVWKEGSAADHYRFADAYQRVAQELLRAGATYNTI